MYKQCHIGLVFQVVEHSIHAKDREYVFSHQTHLENSQQKRVKEYEQHLEQERERKKMELRELNAKETLYEEEEEGDGPGEPGRGAASGAGKKKSGTSGRVLNERGLGVITESLDEEMGED